MENCTAFDAGNATNRTSSFCRLSDCEKECPLAKSRSCFDSCLVLKAWSSTALRFGRDKMAIAPAENCT